MTSATSSPTSTASAEPQRTPPYTRTIRVVAGVSLLLAGLLNGLSQYVETLLTGDMEWMLWGVEHQTPYHAEHLALVTSALFMPLGLLGVAQVCRWRSPVLTAIATPLTIWGMWGFHNILAMGYVSLYVAPQALAIDDSIVLSEFLPSEPGTVATALVPHLLGSLVGLLLLSVAAWRSRAFPRTAVVLLVAFLVWDFFLPPVGPLEAHLLLAVAWGWMGLRMIRMSHDTWRGVPIL